jgi:Zn-dependent protease with chaperone function
MTTAGIVHPRVLLSTTAEFLLTPNELSTALNHELAHVRRRDNLKKLLLRLVPFPGMSGLETAWLEATEIAADDAAVSSTSQALDLAAALLKLSRLAPLEIAPRLTAGLVHSPASAMNARIERLVAWTEPLQRPQKSPIRYALGAVAVGVAALAFSYSSLLVGVHEATELLVR